MAHGAGASVSTRRVIKVARAVRKHQERRLRQMNIRKTLIAGLALAVAVAFSPLPELQAATFVSPGSQPGTDNLAQSVKMKKKAKPAKMKRHRKARKAKRAGSRAGCKGPYMYRKKGKCMDARNK